MKNKFAERLTELLEDLGISKREMARQLEISAQSISDWSTGKITPTIEMLYIICEKYNKSADYMIGIKKYSNEKYRI